MKKIAVIPFIFLFLLTSCASKPLFEDVPRDQWIAKTSEYMENKYEVEYNTIMNVGVNLYKDWLAVSLGLDEANWLTKEVETIIRDYADCLYIDYNEIITFIKENFYVVKRDFIISGPKLIVSTKDDKSHFTLQIGYLASDGLWLSIQY